MQMNNVVVALMNFFIKASFWLITIVSAILLLSSISEGKFVIAFYVFLFWLSGSVVWVILSSGWLVLSKIAAHLESIDKSMGNTHQTFFNVHNESATSQEKDQTKTQ